MYVHHSTWRKRLFDVLLSGNVICVQFHYVLWRSTRTLLWFCCCDDAVDAVVAGIVTVFFIWKYREEWVQIQQFANSGKRQKQYQTIL